MTTYEIPLLADSQRLTVTLGGVVYDLSVIWRSGTGWVLDIYSADDVLLVGGIPLVTGLDLLQQFRYLGIGGSLIVLVNGGILEAPAYDELGAAGRLYFVTE